jgi:hypothetical protein
MITTVMAAVLAAGILSAPPGAFAAQDKPGKPLVKARPKAKYYFNISEINIGKFGDSKTVDEARELLKTELESRPEFTSDLGGASDTEAIIGEIKRRGLRGFRVSLRLDKLSKELKEPKPGGRLKQLAVELKLSVFGTTLPGEKLAFSGEGNAIVEAEIVEKRLEEEAVPLVHDVMAQAIKQAVDQAVMKLSMPVSAPMNETKRKRKAK